MPASDPLADAPLFIVLNAHSGRGEAGEKEVAIRRVLTEAHRAHELFVVRDAQGLPQAVQQAVQRARAACGVVVAAGGDGTLNTVVQALLPTGLPFGALPQGTFNYFGRQHGIPLEIEAATRALLGAHARPLQVGLLNDRVFLVNASLGLHPKLLEDREAYKREHGRSRSAALWSGLRTVLRERAQLTLRIEHEGKGRLLRTPTLFVANNRLQLERIGIAEAPAVEAGELVALAVRPVSTLAMLGLAARGALGTLGDADATVTFAFREMRVQPGSGPRARPMKVAVDGEVMRLPTPLHFRVAPQKLLTLLPEQTAAAAA